MPTPSLPSSPHRTSLSKPNKVQQVQFQTSGVLLFMGVKKLYGPEISRLLQCMFKFLDNSLTFFLTTKGKKITSRWTIWIGLRLNAGTTENFFIVDHPKEDRMNGILNDRLYVDNPVPTDKAL